MPIVVFAPSHAALTTPQGSGSPRTMIQVSDAVAVRLEIKLGGREGVLTARHLPKLRELASFREFDADLRLLIQALEGVSELHVRLV